MLDLIQDPFFAFVIFLVLQVADVITTRKALARGGREANPIVAWLMRRFGERWVVVKCGGGLIAGVILMGTGAVFILWLVCAFYLLVILNNIRVGT